MKLTSIAIENFRNLKRLDIEPAGRLNLITGDNGSGKTSVLEAIFYCCTGRSLRGAVDQAVINRDEEYCRIEIAGLISDQEEQVALAWGRKEGKQITVSGVKGGRLKDLYEYFHAVAFVPEDVDLVLGPPSSRRQLLDLYLSQGSRAYLSDLIGYYKVLKQRNALLREFGLDDNGESAPELLEVWDQQLAQFGGRLTGARLRFLDRYKGKQIDYYHRISGNDDAIGWSLDTNLPDSSDPVNNLLAGLTRSRSRDLHLGVTSVGPHRDDLRLLLRDQVARGYASQGEAKSLALAIKFTVFDFLAAELGEPPLLLLDEVGAQLDSSRLSRLLTILPDLGQVFLTAAKPGELRQAVPSGAEVSLSTPSAGPVAEG
jgi:DNA replication and repair protein RecF